MNGPGFMFGKRRETGIWIAPTSRWRILGPRARGHDSLFVAAGRLRIRIVLRDLEAPDA